MHPAFSVIFLTTLIGAGQGLFIALFASQVGAWLGLASTAAGAGLYVEGSAVALALLAGGLVASFFHLGHPERGWRAIARWRTSWLSREVIVLPAFMVVVLVHGLVVHLGGEPSGDAALIAASVGLVLGVALFVCTGMIYACMRFLQEWATPLTVVNFALLGTASGFTLAAALAGRTAPQMVGFYATGAIFVTGLALVTRAASLVRNARIVRKSTVQSAIGVRDHRIRQVAQGAMGGSFNTREFFHGAARARLDAVRRGFVVLVFVLPVALLGAALALEAPALLVAAAAVQLLGLQLERWYFFADATHPQNLYYQAA